MGWNCLRLRGTRDDFDGRDCERVYCSLFNCGGLSRRPIVRTAHSRKCLLSPPPRTHGIQALFFEDDLPHRRRAFTFAFQVGAYVHPADYTVGRADDQHYWIRLLPPVTGPARVLDDRVRDELEALPPDMQARFSPDCRADPGIWSRTGSRAHVKHLEGPLWDMRMKGRDGTSRAVYVTAKCRRVVVVRVFVKKTQQTPRREIEIALQRAKEA
jgi:phage-related protein